jgi:hypothetical protein
VRLAAEQQGSRIIRAYSWRCARIAKDTGITSVWAVITARLVLTTTLNANISIVAQQRRSSILATVLILATFSRRGARLWKGQKEHQSKAIWLDSTRHGDRPVVHDRQNLHSVVLSAFQCPCKPPQSTHLASVTVATNQNVFVAFSCRGASAAAQFRKVSTWLADLKASVACQSTVALKVPRLTARLVFSAASGALARKVAALVLTAARGTIVTILTGVCTFDALGGKVRITGQVRAWAIVRTIICIQATELSKAPALLCVMTIYKVREAQ